MADPLMRDAFDHHVWASLLLMDTCLDLSPDQLETSAPGTYGTILSTMQHLVGADASYLYVLSGGTVSFGFFGGGTIPGPRGPLADIGMSFGLPLFLFGASADNPNADVWTLNFTGRLHYQL